jgi:hypothetical protein
LFALHVKQDINVALMQEYIEKWWNKALETISQ